MNRSSVFRFSAAFILFLIALAGCNKKENTVAIIGVSLMEIPTESDPPVLSGKS